MTPIPKHDGLCALFRHDWKPMPDKPGWEQCKYCPKTRKMKEVK